MFIMENTDTTLPQLLLLIFLVLERIFKTIVSSHCYKKFKFQSSLGSFEIQTEEQEQKQEEEKKEEN